MHVIRTAEDLARALDSPLEPELHSILAGHAERLAAYPDYAFEELAVIVIAEPGDRLANLEAVVGGGGSTSPEFVVSHSRWVEATFILSDDGFGLILLADQSESANAHVVAELAALADDLA